MKRLISGLPFFVFVASVLAQRATPSPSPSGTIDPATAAAAAAGMAGLFGMYGVCCFVQVLFYVVLLGGWIFTGIWVMTDAKNRNSENAQTVTILGWLLWPVGLIMHLATRPKGNLVPCPHCQKKRLEGSATCPHCHQP
jgi:putative Ca2+/H+ antiporter (TMEM165/GDT1 family)